jgi:4-amino-4-deoxy-L-arabinose transferase-like glycosyltransferase
MSLRPAPAGSALRGEGIALALFGVFLVASLFAWVHPWYEQLPDASLYITTARALAAGEGYTYLGVPFHARPPGFSALLAPVIAAAGTDFRILNLFVAAWGLVAVLLLYRLERERLGWPLALLVAGALWLNPGFRRLSCQVMSDVPALALLLACLLVERWASRADAPRRELVLGLAVGLAAYVRSSLILLVPAILAARVAVRWSGERPRERARSFILRRAALFPLVAVLVLLPWSIRDAVRAPPPPADQTYLYAHFTGVLHKDPGDPASRRLSVGEIFSRAQMRARQVGAVLGSRMRSWVRG